MVYYASYIIIGILIIVHSRESESAAENFQLKWTPQLLRKSRQLLLARLSKFHICSGRKGLRVFPPSQRLSIYNIHASYVRVFFD